MVIEGVALPIWRPRTRQRNQRNRLLPRSSSPGSDGPLKDYPKKKKKNTFRLTNKKCRSTNTIIVNKEPFTFAFQEWIRLLFEANSRFRFIEYFQELHIKSSQPFQRFDCKLPWNTCERLTEKKNQHPLKTLFHYGGTPNPIESHRTWSDAIGYYRFTISRQHPRFNFLSSFFSSCFLLLHFRWTVDEPRGVPLR